MRLPTRFAAMSERDVTAEAVELEHHREVHEAAHWAYVVVVLGLSFVAMLALIAILGAGQG
jgi:hypothetical protein